MERPLAVPLGVVVPREGQRKGEFRAPLAAGLAVLLVCCALVVQFGSGQQGGLGPNELAQGQISTEKLAGAPVPRPPSVRTTALDEDDDDDDEEDDTVRDPDLPRQGYSEEITGIFTGHSKGKKGGPLTFGKNTYFNVFNPNGESDSCNPGTYGEGGEKCLECPENKWCPGGQSVVDCPPNTYSLPGAYIKSRCGCKPGFYGPNNDCKACPVNSYCPGGTKIHSCPKFSSSGAGKFECKCDGGYFGDFNDCKECPAGSYCGGDDHQKECPTKSSSPSGSVNATQCSCEGGYYEPSPGESPAGPVCAACPPNYYCPGQAMAVPCPRNTLSAHTSDAEGDCKCKAGYYGLSASECKSCPTGFYCPGGAAPKACPKNSYSPAGATTLEDCACVPGFVGTNPESCVACPAGSYCEGGASVKSCPAKTRSLEGSSRCACKGGYKGPGMYDCSKCPFDMYCPGGKLQEKCPPNTHTIEKGQSRERECQCGRGFYGAGGDDCSTCPANKYCPMIGADPKKCPPESTVAPGAEKASKCECRTGFYNARSVGLMSHVVGPKCTLCPAGSYCPGKGVKHRCPGPTTSAPGTGSSSKCTCAAGYYQVGTTCKRCPAGSFCPGGPTSIQCPINSRSGVGATKSEDCSCKSGYFGDSPEACKKCPKGSFCPGGSRVIACPYRSTALPGASRCTCKAGYYGSNPRRCRKCPRNRFCPGGRQIQYCPRYSRSRVGAKAVGDCKCSAGYRKFKDDSDVMTCTRCPSGSYCPGQSKRHSCPNQMDSNKGARSKAQCGCMAGYYDGGAVPGSNYAWVYTGKLKIKEAGFYTFCITSDDGSRLFLDDKMLVNNDGLHGTLKRCGGKQMSAGTVAVKADGFQAGGGVSMFFRYRGPDTGNIYKYVESVGKDDKGKTGWVLKMYRSRRWLRRMPALNRVNYIGTTSVRTVHIPLARGAGKFRSLILPTCKKCPIGQYCPGAFPTRRWRPVARRRRCPGYRWSPRKGAQAVQGCSACRPGFYGDSYKRCRGCPRGHYCPGGKKKIACPEGATTWGYRRTKISQCICNVGYERIAGKSNWQCQQCSSGWVCGGRNGRHRHRCPNGATSARGSSRWRHCKCAVGTYGNGFYCHNCQRRYYCTGDGRRRYCGAYAYSPSKASSMEECTCRNFKKQFPTVKKSKEPSVLKKWHCRNWSLCQFQRWCWSVGDCRGFTFKKNKMYGYGCFYRGLKKNLGDMKDTSTYDFYEKDKSRQSRDSVALLRRIGVRVPVCAKKGSPVVAWQHCSPHRNPSQNWKAVLYQGAYPYPHSRRCDNDEDLCQVNNCGLRGGDMSSIDIPSGYKVVVYDQTNFRGHRRTFSGPMDADANCLTKFSIYRRRSWNDRVRSLKVMKA